MTRNVLDISVIICAYADERWYDLIAAVSSAKKQTVPPFEIVVVIDHNLPLLEHVHASLPDVIVVENGEARGASGARNSGVAAAHGSLIAFLDDDAVAEPDWLEQLVREFENPDVLGVGGALEPIWLGQQPRWFPSEFNWVVGCTYTGLPERTSPVRNLIAANMSVRREVFESIGGFRSGYGNVKAGAYSCVSLFRSCAGDEETEFCIRALQQWPQSVWLYQPQARVRHKVPTSRTRWQYYLRRCYDEGFGKALLSKLVGAKHGLASERAYMMRTLPWGVIRGVRDALFRHDLSGFARAAAIIVGLTVTSAGYLMGAIFSGPQNHNSVDSGGEPIRKGVAA